jgi:pyruvate dehydrogenase E2 component (dihydrolipoamide acetyltransferase)
MNAAARLVEVRVPDMGNFKDVAIIDVLVKPGEKIEPEAPLVTLETEKATMDVPSTVGGVIEKIHIAKGGTVSPGDLIVTVRSGDAPAAGPSGESSGPQAAAVPVRVGTSGTTATSGTTGTGAGTTGGPAQASASASDSGGTRAADGESTDGVAGHGGIARMKTGGAGADAAASEPTFESGETSAQAHNGAAATELPPARAGLPPINEPGFSRAHAGPSVRRFARELGVDLTQVKGGGFKGRVTHDDVKAFVKQFLAAAQKAPAPGGAALPAVPSIDFAQFGEIETLPLSRIQKISGPRLHASWVNIPHVTQFDDADITDLEDLRGKLKQQALQANIKLTPLAFILRACVKTLQEFPLFNASLDANGANLVVKKYVHLGFAADTPNGLVVPVLRDANRKDVYEIARQLGELSEKARAGKLSAAEMQGGSFTVSSLGGIGGTAFTPIINAPEVAILGVSRSVMRPIFRDGAFVPRLILPLSLSYDHRVIDGASAARFTTFLVQTLADPRGLMEAVP